MTAPTPKSKRAARLIMAAIGDLHNLRPSMDAITRHITEEYHVPENDIKRYVVACIEKGIAFGAIKQTRGKYEMGVAFSDWHKKDVKPKSPTASGKVEKKSASKVVKKRAKTAPKSTPKKSKR